MASQRLLVDIHTHVYLPRYASFLRSRTSVPRIFSRTSPTGKTEERLVILDNEPSGGRPIGAQYWDRDEKLKFMDRHGIDVSIVSTANPWLDFLPAPTAHQLAGELNDDLETYCSTSPSVSGNTLKRLYGFGLLPLVPSITTTSLLETIEQISKLPHLKGIIMGTRGVGKGLDDEALEPVWEAIAKAGLVIFLHPHYGVDGSAWGDKENGHVLPLALGFPFETTTATTRLILSGVFDRHPNLRLLLAHSGGTLPQLSSRLASCIDHDPEVASRLAHDARYYLGKLYFDAVAYGSEELGFVSDVIGRADKFSARTASANVSKDMGVQKRILGSQRMLFGTDHPFFPPLSETEKWKSVVENLEAIDAVDGWGQAEKDVVRGGNAMQVYGMVQMMEYTVTCTLLVLSFIPEYPQSFAFRLLNLQAKIDMLHRLMHDTRAQYIDFIDSPLMQIQLRNIPTTLKQELSLPTPFLPQPPTNMDQLITFHIIQHDYISSSVDSFVRLCFRANLYFKQEAKPAYFTSLFDRGCDRS